MNKFWYIILTLIVAAFIGLAIYLFPNLMVYKHNVSDIVDSSYDGIWLVDESAYEFCKSDSTLNETFLPKAGPPHNFCGTSRLTFQAASYSGFIKPATSIRPSPK